MLWAMDTGWKIFSLPQFAGRQNQPVGAPGTAFVDASKSQARAIDERSAGFLAARSIPRREGNLCHGRSATIRGAALRRAILRAVSRRRVGSGLGIFCGRAASGLRFRSRTGALVEQNRRQRPDSVERPRRDGSRFAALVSRRYSDRVHGENAEHGLAGIPDGGEWTGLA